jgi:hypothetical protein
VMAMRVNNPAADPLRAVLMRYGAPNAAPLPPPPGAYYAPPPQQPMGYAAAPNGPVQEQSLPPPR